MTDRLADLYSLLQQADGAPASDRAGSDLSWMWTELGATPLLDWIVNNVNSKCILTRDQLSEYRRLDSTGRTLDSMIGKQCGRPSKGTDRVEVPFNQERIASDVAALTRQQRISMEILSNGRLRHAKLSSKLHSAKKCLEQALLHVADQQQLLNAAFHELISAMNYTSGNIHSVETSIIQNQLDQYLEADNLFLNNVKGAFDTLRLRRREIEEMVLVPEKSHQENVEELERIKSIFAISESQRIDADIYLSEVMAEQNFVVRQTYDEKSAESLCDDLKHQFDDLYHNRLQPLLQRLAKYQKTTVLRGDYLLKISRQRNFVKAQNRILDELIHQRARHSLLYSAFLRAQSDQEKFVELVNSVQVHLDNIESKLERSKASVTDQVSSETRKALNDSDQAELAVEKALCMATGENPSSLLVTYDRIASMAKALINNIAAFESNHGRANSEHNRILSELVHDANQLYSLLTISSSTSQPTLSHQPLMKLATTVQQMMENLKEKVAVLQIEESSKRQTLSDDEDLLFERDIFINFFENPAVLDEDARKLCLKIKSL